MFNYRYLGIEVDEALGWQSQVDIICKNVSAGLGALKRIRSLVPHQTLLRMYEIMRLWLLLILIISPMFGMYVKRPV